MPSQKKKFRICNVCFKLIMDFSPQEITEWVRDSSKSAFERNFNASPVDYSATTKTIPKMVFQPVKSSNTVAILSNDAHCDYYQYLSSKSDQGGKIRIIAFRSSELRTRLRPVSPFVKYLLA